MKEQSLLTKPTDGVGTLVFDLETNGLLRNATRIHCASIYWVEDDNIETYNDEKYAEDPKTLPMGNHSLTTAINYLSVADVVVGHNILGFDLPLIKRIYPFFEYPPVVVDTLLLSRLYHPNLLDIDNKTDKIPQKLRGRHSLEAYGHRLGEYKGDFSKTTDWKEWSKEMQDYCEQDVAVTKKLCDYFHPYLTGSN